MPKPIVIVGAGLAGLACARKLHHLGVNFLLIDADSRVGGRLKTDLVEGFRLDHGFQVLFTAYPYAKGLLDFDALKLRAFEPGSIVWDGLQQHVLHNERRLATAASGLFGIADKVRVLNWTSDCKLMSVEEIYDMPDMSTLDHLRAYGFSEAFIDRFARPFFGGIFLDRSLSVSVRQFAFVWKMLSEGQTVVPAEGMEAIPRQLAAELPASCVRLNTRVKEILREDGRATGVALESGETIHAAAVVVATEADAAGALLGKPILEGSKSSTCVYFEAPAPPVDEKLIVLNAQEGLVNEVVPCSLVAPELAPKGKHLVSVTVLGHDARSDADLVEAIKAEVGPWFPGRGVSHWRHLKTYRVRYAQMPQPPGVFELLPKPESGIEGLYLCGEYTTDGSINGALKSGVRVGDLLARKQMVGAR